ncbi:MAG: hypothetical protein CM1200mP20_15020 [Pseudomonadota bacterium]|nr:MAG: hypothetical protein CM1200mP20_15020 [Pseudomonadota bacterium]
MAFQAKRKADIMMSLLDSSIEFVVCRHEQAAAFIADVYGAFDGKTGGVSGHARVRGQLTC